MLQKFTYNLQMALDALFQRPLRSFLTSLGIIFGVGAVIAMMAIGQGAQEEILEQMTILGANNLIVEPIIQQKDEEVTEETGQEATSQKFSPGLTLADAESFQTIIPAVSKVSPEIVIETTFLRNGRKRSGKLVGVTNVFFEHSSFKMDEGQQQFSPDQLELASQVCVIGAGVKSKFFSQEDPIGKPIKVGKNWLRVVGVANERKFSQSSLMDLGVRDYDMDIYAPVETVLLRYKNRNRISPSDLQKASMMQNMSGDDGATQATPESKNYHQIDRMTVQIKDGQDMVKVADIIRRMLARRHNGVIDTEVKIPEELLAQKQRTTNMFNLVLISIAAISLLIGGIGIMNIMFASVMERIKEIGVRLALGATKRDIVFQFLSESVILSIIGGLVGVGFGVGLSLIIKSKFDVPAVLSWPPIVIAFAVAFSVGVFFGFFPALKAAKQDPVVSLRHE
ncbi:MAG: ABC transporter permease [Bacteroidetes bacterium]|nr:ABC transporter permease [Bacteroidota bacterium]MBP6720887.1 ABC transporter permease [Bacteroidia bacterium]